jgi:hypothetical protein
MRRLRRLSFFLLGFERGGNHDKVGGEGSVFRLHVSKILVMGQWNGSFCKKKKK